MITSTLLAQATAITATFLAVAQSANDPAVIVALMKWTREASPEKVYACYIALSRTKLPLQKTTEYIGSLMYQRADSARFRIERKRIDDQYTINNDFSAYIWKGQDGIEYDRNARIVTRLQQLPMRPKEKPKETREEKTARFIENWFRLLLRKPLAIRLVCDSSSVIELLEQFTITIQKQDGHYLYLKLIPRQTIDAKFYDSLQIVLHGLHLPQPITPYSLRTIVIRQANGHEIETWEFMNRQIAEKVDRAVFEFVEPPADWKIQGSWPKKRNFQLLWNQVVMDFIEWLIAVFTFPYLASGDPGAVSMSGYLPPASRPRHLARSPAAFRLAFAAFLHLGTGHFLAF